jgi:hypothetical protein
LFIEILSIGKNAGNSPAPSATGGLTGGSVQTLAKNGKRGRKCRDLSSHCGLPEGSAPPIHYNLLTAADEKIPLSVVHVNNKPQYIVFLLQSLHLLRKHGQSSVESLDAPRTARSWAVKFGQFSCNRKPAAHFGVIDKRSPRG